VKKIDRSDLLNKKYGSWLIVGTSNVGSDRHPKISCKCECGEIVRVSIDNVLSGKSKGCRKCLGKRRSGNQNHAWSGFKDIPAHFYGIMVRGAKERNIEVSITIEDLNDLWIKQNGLCALSGLPLKLGSKKLGKTASVDRKDSSIGYTKENIQFVHKDINRMKNKYQEEYFIEMCNRVHAHNFRARIG
jgi:hypothetical protein